MSRLKIIQRIIIVIFLISLPIVLFILPATYFDSGESVCLSHVFFDLDCYGCGMTKAIMHLIHFDVVAAKEYNRLSFVVLPLLVALWLKVLLKQFDIEVLKWF